MHVEIVGVQKEVVGWTRGESLFEVMVYMLRRSHRRRFKDVAPFAWPRKPNFHPLIEATIVTAGAIKKLIGNDP